MRWLGAFGSVVTACASTSAPPPTTAGRPTIVPPVHDDAALTSPPPPFTFVPDGAAVERYGEALPADATTGPGDDATVPATHAVADPRLARAAKQLAPLLDRGGPIELDVVAFVFAWNGIVEPPVVPIVSRGDSAAVMAAVGTLPETAHVGIAHRGDATLVLATDPAIAFAPFPRRITASGAITLSGTLDGRYADVGIQVNGGKHVHADVVPKRRGRVVTFEIPCQGLTGQADVRVLGIGTASATVIAKFPVWCGSEPPVSLVIDPLHDPRGDGDPDKAAHRVFELLQRDRAAAGMRVLAWDAGAAAAAKGHADQLASSESGGGDKAAAVKLPSTRVVENVGEGVSVDDAYARLMAAEQRHAAAMANDYTSAGVGVASANGRVFIAQIFVTALRTIDTEAAARDLEKRVVASSKLLTVEPKLARVARTLADARARGASDVDLQHILDTAYGPGYPKLWYTVTTTPDLASLDAKTLDHVSKVDHIGIAITQGVDPKLGKQLFTIITVVGKKTDNY